MLIEMMHSADVETAHQGTGVVANLAEVVENQGKMVESGESAMSVGHHSSLSSLKASATRTDTKVPRRVLSMM